MGKRQTVPTRNTRARFIPLERMQELRNLDGKGFTYDNAGRLSKHVDTDNVIIS